MTNYGSYTGKVAKIDLTAKTWEEYPISDTDRKLFLGGKGLAARILNDFITGPIDPLGPENVLVVSNCPLNGSGCPSSSRFNVSAVSPLTGLITSSNSGGSFGISLKRAGYDAIVILGKCETLTILEITQDGIEFKDAQHLKGKCTGETQQLIGGRSGKLVIGPAGENMVRYACAISDERASGRGGIGAVMGSKNLKAITAFGVHPLNFADKAKLDGLKKKWTEKLCAHPITGKQLPRLGTAALITPMQNNHILATKNFSAGTYEDFRDVSGETLAEKYLIKNKGCPTCPIQCTRIVEVEGKAVKGPELETLGLLGPNILNNDLQKIINWNYELDELGMDTISAAGSIAFAMELNEKGMWKNGLEFGKTDNISKMFEKIAHRDGEIANMLAEGTRFMSDKFGGKEFAMNAKGMELAAYEPRGAVGQGLGYSVGNRGGCHLNAGYMVVLEGLGLNIDPLTTHGKAQLTIMFQNLMEAVSSGGSCLFTTYAVFPGMLYSKPNSMVTRIVNKVMPYLGGVIKLANKFPKLLQVNVAALIPHTVAIQAATGIKMSIGNLMVIGARAYNLERLINARLGVDKSWDTLPARLTHEQQIPGNDKTRVPQQKLLKQYYKGRGWDEEGRIKPSTIKYYGLDKLDSIQKRSTG